MAMLVCTAEPEREQNMSLNQDQNQNQNQLALVAVQPEQNQNELIFAMSEEELEQQLREAVEASADDFAFRMQVQEAIEFSSPASDGQFLLQLPQQLPPEDVHVPSSSSGVASSSSAAGVDDTIVEDDSDEDDIVTRGDVYGKKSLKRSIFRNLKVKTPALPRTMCGICFDNEDPGKEMFEGLHCLHRYCKPCMISYIHTKLEQRRPQIFCPHDGCDEPLTLMECKHFLPDAIFEQWSIVNLENLIPISDKFYCPFPDCSGLLIKDDESSAGSITSAECPFCYRLFCARCNVPWHAGLDCEEYQALPEGDKTESDFKFVRLAEERKWKRCPGCKTMVELALGCNHMTCRCGHQFCYICGDDWRSNDHTCPTYAPV